MKIHGFVYLVVGTGIAIISKTVGTKMIFFVYLGILFAVMGIVKVILEPKKKTQSPVVYNGNHYVARHHRVTQPRTAQTAPRPAQQRPYTAGQVVPRFCPHCRTPLVPGHTFCPRCGYRAAR